MSDWTSGFQAFQQGMGMLADANERKRRQQLEEQRMGYEKDRLQIERDRAAREAARNKIELDLLGLRKGAIDKSLEPLQVPAGMRTKTAARNEFGGTDYTFERTPGDPVIKDIGGKRFLITEDGKAEELKPNWLDIFGTQGQAAGGLPPVAGPSPGVTAPGTTPGAVPQEQGNPPALPPVSPPGAVGTPQANPAMRLRSFSPGSGPVFEPVPKGNTVEIVSRKLPNGGEGLFLRKFDPEKNEETLTPYTDNSKLSADVQEKLTLAFAAMDALPQMARDIRKYGDEGGPAASKLGGLALALGGTPSEARRAFDQAAARTLTPIAKGISGETGALSENEQTRYGALIPAFQDTKVARQQKFQALKKDVLNAAKNRLTLMRQNGQDTTAMEKVFAEKMALIDAAEAEASLPDGVTRVNSQEEYNALPSGALYVDFSGDTKRKP